MNNLMENVFHTPMSSRMVRGLAIVLCLAGTAGCDHAADRSSDTVEVAHSWTSGGEAKAVDVLARAYDKAGGQWKHMSVAGFQNANALVLNRLAGGVPPGAVQFIAGQQSADLASHGLLVGLDDVAHRNRWRTQLSPELMGAISVDGHVYQVPLNLHVNNYLFVSRKALAAVGMDGLPGDWPGFFAMLDRFQAKGIIPLALGGQAWQEQLLFDAVLLSRGGRDLFLKVYRDRDVAAVRSPAFRDVAETFARLRRYVDPGSPGRNWDDATALLMQGKAGAQIMGDWAVSEFKRAGLSAPRDYLCALGPVDRGAIASSDVLVFPRSIQVDATRQLQLAEVVSEPSVQKAFSDKLGSLPAFGLEPDSPGLSHCDRIAASALSATGRSVPYVTSILPPDVGGDVNDVVANFWSGNAPDVDHFIDRFARTLETAT